MITSNDLKNGMTILVGDVIHQVIEFQHIKPGKGPAFVRTKLRNLRSGSVVDKTFRAKEPIEQAFVERGPREYLYRDNSGFHFMDPDTFEQMVISAEIIEPHTKFLKENDTVNVTIYNGEVIDVTLQPTVELIVTEAPPGVKGDTASGTTKPVTLETGTIIQVPLFIDTGQKIRVDTRTGEYVTRV